MTSDPEDNPCCQKKGTLVITIEPCSKGQKTKEDRYYFTGERYVPGLPQKTPRTMEIEVKIKGKDQVLFSDEESPAASLGENVEEVELATHSPSGEENDEQRRGSQEIDEEVEPKKGVSSSASMKSSKEASKAKITCSSKTIPLERKPCSETCPGPLICLQKNQHFLGDRCKLHDPTFIGKQILAMHKNGIIRKRLYMNELIYPDHILSAVSEINRRQTFTVGNGGSKYDTVSGDNRDIVEEVHVRKTIVPIESPMQSKEADVNVGERKTVITLDPNPTAKDPRDDISRKKGSGCYC